jgi:twitching motility protein PilI
MANKEALRELQGRLAERLQEVRDLDHTVGWLAVEVAGYPFLLPLVEAGEIFQPGQLVGVPHVASWFLGVANLRGALTGVVDLAGFLGLRDRVPASVRDQARLVAFNPALELNVALLVDRLAGLRNLEQLTAEPPGEQSQPAFVGGRFRDAAGRVWQELRLAILAHDERFLRIAGGE